ncbi:hypothetical protein [Microbacterium sp. LWH12-1.2]|uniref:hypothetical protein n=1 Tax=Microbacterium sp. LWH12-1.2 TaxID=3135259 RepID=UPI0034287D3A
MDVLERVRDVNAGAEIAEEHYTRSRSLLLEGIDESISSARRRAARRPMFLIAGAVAGVAAATVGVVIVNQLTAVVPQVEANPVETADPRRPGGVLTPAPAPTPATPTEVLRAAANAAASFAAPQLQPGQYLRREWTTEEIILYSELGAGGWGMGGSHQTATSAWQLRHGGVMYIPEDLSASWYAEGTAIRVGDTYGDQVEADEQSRRDLATLPGERPLEPFTKFAPWDGVGEVETLDVFFASMPRDPDELITWVQEFAGTDQPGWADGKVGWFFIDMLSYNVGPADLRAAMYRALSLLPGSTVSDEVDGVRTITFDSQLALAEATEFASYRMTISIEMSTGTVLETSERAEAGIGVVPTDVPDVRTRYTTSIVDSLPAE